MAQQYVVVIGGPTGVGKTAVAIAMAQQLKTEIINADSRQVYTELEIGVGRPSAVQLQQVRHHLVGHVSIHEPYSAGQYVAEANAVLQTLFQKNNITILCGGTGLYIKSVMEGLDVFPSIPDTITDKWTHRFKTEGVAALAAELQIADPEYAAVVDLQNPMRLIRALSVTEFTAKPYSSFRKSTPQRSDYTFIPILLELPRAELYERINQRVIDMLDAGWLDEAARLYPDKELKALHTVGYKELFDVIENKISLPEAIHAIRQSTRRYAKRQLTWFHNQGTWHTFHPDDLKSISDFISAQ